MNPTDYNNLTVAITGGAGLIGSFVAEELVRQKAKVIVIDDFSKGLRANIQSFRDSIELREGDLEDAAFAMEALSGVDVVFHLASRAYGVGYSMGHHLETMQHNEQVNNNVLAAIAIHKPRHVLAASSSCVYRDDGPDTMPEVGVFEGEPEMANWGYGWAKRFLEQKLLVLSRERSIPVTIVRPFNIYGERYRWVGTYSGAIPMLVKRILDGENPVVVWGSGKQRRNYLHAQDCARVMVELVAKGYAGAPVNIGTEDTLSMAELVETICRISGQTPQIEFDLSKPEGRFIKSSDSTRLRAILGDFPIATISLEEGLGRMLTWYQRTFVDAP